MLESETKECKATKLLKSLGYSSPKKLTDRGERNTIKITLFEAEILKDLNSKEKVVIRMVENLDPEVLAEFEKEYEAAKIVKDINHPNIVKINKVIPYEKYLIIEMPKYFSDLEQLVLQNETASEETCLPTDLIFMVAYQLTNTLVFLETKKIIHRDISLANLLVEEFDKEKGILKIVLADFERMHSGPPKMCDGDIDLSSGGQVTSPPELYSETYDVWELGAIIYQMITGDLTTTFRLLQPHQLRIHLYGTDEENQVVTDGLYQKRLRNSYMVPYLWSCFQNHAKRIPSVAIMEEILAQFYFYVSNTKKILTKERKEKPKEFFVLNFFQHLATNEDKFEEILKMESKDMNNTELYIKNVFNTMFGNKGVFN
ncbi:predicted protein, partial [Naegleria gruberi]